MTQLSFVHPRVPTSEKEILNYLSQQQKAIDSLIYNLNKLLGVMDSVTINKVNFTTSVKKLVDVGINDKLIVLKES